LLEFLENGLAIIELFSNYVDKSFLMGESIVNSKNDIYIGPIN